MFNTKTDAPQKTGDRPEQEPMPLGSQTAKVVHVIPGQTSTGKVRFGIKFENEAGEVSWHNCYGPNVDGSGFATPMGERFFYKTMANLSMGKKFIDEAASVEEVAEALLGSEALVTVADEAYNGKVYRKVIYVDAVEPF